MNSFKGTLKIMTIVAIILKLIAYRLVLIWSDFEGFLITTPAILGLLCFMAFKYYNKTEEENKRTKSVLLVLLSSVISFLVVFVFAMMQLSNSGFHG